jgi:probable HAF family extracellular repeat protein
MRFVSVSAPAALLALAACESATVPPRPQGDALPRADTVGATGSRPNPVITIIDLGGPHDATGTADACNAAGQVVGTGGTRRGGVFLWQNGVKTDLDFPAGFTGIPHAVNASGQIVGDMPIGTGTHAFLWTDGTLTDLGTLGGAVSLGLGLNASGDVVGASTLDGDDFVGEHAFVWRHGTMMDLGALSGAGGTGAHDINDAGVVVGHGAVADGTLRPFVWRQGTVTVLPFGGHAFAVNASGQIAGNVFTPEGLSRAYRWDDGELTTLGTLGGSSSSASDIGNAGDVVGVSETGDGSLHGFLWREGTMIDLGTLPGDDRSHAECITPDGRIIAGFSMSSAHGPRPVAWVVR